jgi:hypothetical protein
MSIVKKIASRLRHKLTILRREGGDTQEKKEARTLRMTSTTLWDAAADSAHA